MEYPGFSANNLSENEIMNKMGDIQKRLTRPGLRSDAYRQLLSMLEILRSEVKERNFRKMVETDPKWKSGLALDTDDQINSQDDLDNLIDIN
jgi:hypothetical protein